MKTFKKTYCFWDYARLSIYNLLFPPNYFILVISLFFFIYFDFKKFSESGFFIYSITVLSDQCALFCFLVIINLMLIRIYQMIGYYKHQTYDEITFSDDFYTVANISRELKFFWKDVKACRASDYQIFVNNSDTIIYRFSRKGFTDEEWKEINEIIKGKVKTVSLYPYTIIMAIGLIIGGFRWLWFLILYSLNYF